MAVTQIDLDNSTLLRVDKLNHEDMEQALITADGIGYFDTLADFKASTKVYKEVHISGYYTKGDGAFGSNYHYLLPDDGTVYTEQGGVQVQTASGRWYRLNTAKGQISVALFGVRGDGTDESVKVQSALDVGNNKVYFPNGNYKFNVEIKNNSTIVGESAKGTIFEPADKTKPIILIERTTISEIKEQYNFGRLEEFTVQSDNTLGGKGISLIAEAPYVIKDIKLEHIVFNDLDIGLYVEGKTNAGEIYHLMGDKLFFKNCKTKAIDGVLIEQSSFGSVFVDEVYGNSQSLISITGNNNSFNHLYTAGALYLRAGHNITINMLRFENTKATRAIDGALLKLNMSNVTILSMIVQTCGEDTAYIESLFNIVGGENFWVGRIGSFGTNYINYPIIDNGMSGKNYTFASSNVATKYTLTQLQSHYLPKLIPNNINFSNWEEQGWLGVAHDNAFVKSLKHQADSSNIEKYAGSKYFDTTDGKVKEYNGKFWKDFDTNIEYGSNLISNGTFVDGTGWDISGSAGGCWDINNGVANSIAGSGDGSLTQGITYEIGAEYLISFDFTRDASSTGNLIVRPDGATSVIFLNADTHEGRQYATWIATVDSTSFKFRVNNAGDFVGTIDNVEVQKIIRT